MRLLFLSVFFVFCFATRTSNSNGPIVKTLSGSVQGTILFSNSSSSPAPSWAFLGIPYAESTAGQQRWTNPVPKKAWHGQVLNATSYGPGCPQKCTLPQGTCPATQSEDCLSLNIFTPVGVSSSSRLPVLFFIPGGRFEQGASDTYLYDGRFFVSRRAMIVVTINYRLGALGFLYTKGGAATGNYGVRDQRLAMQWVQQNIVFFGGDPTRVTIDGQSAGASSVSYHLLSSQSSGLFHAAIAQSNPAALPWKEREDGEKLGKWMSRALKCDDGDLACLRKASVDDVLQAQHDAQQHFNPLRPLDVFLPWTPMVGTGGDALPDQPFHMLSQQGLVNKVPLMTGVVANETMIFVYQGLGANPTEAVYYAFMADVFGVHAPRVLARYPPHLGGTILDTLSLLGTDYIFSCPTRAVASKNQAYLYYFDHVMYFSKVAWGPAYSECYNLTCHGEELVFVFGSASLLINIPIPQGEVALSALLQSAWANMVMSPGSSPVPGWLPFTNATQASMLFSVPSTSAFKFPHQPQCDFFDEIGYGAAGRFLSKLSLFH